MELVRWDKWPTIAVSLIPLITSAVLAWLLLGDVAGGFVRVLGTVGATALIALAMFAVKMLTLPAKMYAEALARAAAAEAALATPDRRVDIALVRGLFIQLRARLMHARSKFRTAPEVRVAAAREYLTDVTAILGPDVASRDKQTCTRIIDGTVDEATGDGMLRRLAAQAGEWSENLSETNISREHPNLARYVEERLAALRASNPVA